MKNRRRYYGGRRGKRKKIILRNGLLLGYYDKGKGFRGGWFVG